MTWFKNISKGVLAAIAVFLAYMAAVKYSREKTIAGGLKERYENQKQLDVELNTKDAKRYLEASKEHEAKARAAKEKAQAKLDTVGKQDEDMASIVSGWRSSRLRD